MAVSMAQLKKKKPPGSLSRRKIGQAAEHEDQQEVLILYKFYLLCPINSEDKSLDLSFFDYASNETHKEYLKFENVYRKIHLKAEYQIQVKL